MFLSARKPFRIDSNDYVSDNQLFKVTSIFAHFHEYKLQTLLEKSVLCNFQIEACLNQNGQPRKLILIIT